MAANLVRPPPHQPYLTPMPLSRSQEPPGSPARADDAADCSIRGRTVLLLEDEALIAVALQADLEDAGYTVAGPFVTCASALEWLAGHRPNLAILDTVLKDGPCKEVALTLTRLGVPVAHSDCETPN